MASEPDWCFGVFKGNRQQLEAFAQAVGTEADAEIFLDFHSFGDGKTARVMLRTGFDDETWSRAFRAFEKLKHSFQGDIPQQ